MDPISYSHSAKQAQRIKKIIANPDSTSGIVTVPSVIATGENITIPAGRTAVLPNIQIDGTLNIDGTMFIPSGATTADIDTQLALKAPLASPALTGTPTAPTATAGTNTTQLATTAYVDRKMTLMTAQNSTSGTSIDFTGIPSWAKRITIMFNGVSTNGTSIVQIQLGTSGGIENTGYLGVGVGCPNTNTPGVLNMSSGFITSNAGSATQTRHGSLSIISVSPNTFIINGSLGLSNDSVFQSSFGSKTLAGNLDRVRITTVNGTDTFDAGSINIMYEG